MNVLERSVRLRDLLARIDDEELRTALTAELERGGEMPDRRELLSCLYGETVGKFIHDNAKTLAALAATVVNHQYQMQAWHRRDLVDVHWSTQGEPDWLGRYSGHDPADLTDIILASAPILPVLSNLGLFQTQPLPERHSGDPQRMPVMVDFIDDLPTIRDHVPAAASLHNVDLPSGETVQFREMTAEDGERLARSTTHDRNTRPLEDADGS